MQCAEFGVLESQMKDRIIMAETRWRANGQFYMDMKKEHPTDGFYERVVAELKRIVEGFIRFRKKCKRLCELYDLTMKIDEIIRNFLYDEWQQRQKNTPRTFLTLEEFSAWRN
jgi:chromosome condensin MukBEF MukE localization factor